MTQRRPGRRGPGGRDVTPGHRAPPGRRPGDRVGAHLGRMAPQPIVGMRRRTKPRRPLFGVLVEGHGRRTSVVRLRWGAPPAGSGAPGRRLVAQRAGLPTYDERRWARPPPLPPPDSDTWVGLSSLTTPRGRGGVVGGPSRLRRAGSCSPARPATTPRGAPGSRRAGVRGLRDPGRPPARAVADEARARWPVLGRWCCCTAPGVLDVGERGGGGRRLGPPPRGGVRSRPLLHRLAEAVGPHLEAGDVGGRCQLRARGPAHRRRRSGVTRASPVAFLMIAVVISVVGCGLLYLRNRTPSSLESASTTSAAQMGARSPRRAGAAPALVEALTRGP